MLNKLANLLKPSIDASIKETSSQAEEVHLYDRLFFALEHRVDIYLDEHMKHKYIKKLLKKTKEKLESGTMSFQEFEAVKFPDGFELKPTPTEIAKLKRLQENDPSVAESILERERQDEKLQVRKYIKRIENFFIAWKENKNKRLVRIETAKETVSRSKSEPVELRNNVLARQLKLTKEQRIVKSFVGDSPFGEEM